MSAIGSSLWLRLSRWRIASCLSALATSALLSLSACSGGGGNSGATATNPSPPGGNTAVNVLTWHYDNSRTGVNSSETFAGISET